MITIFSVIGFSLPIIVTALIMILPKSLIRPPNVVSDVHRPSQVNHVEIDKMLNESSRGEELVERR